MESPIKIAEIDHVVFRCRDQRKLLELHTRLMGLVEERRIDQIGLIQLRAGRRMIHLVPGDVPSVVEFDGSSGSSHSYAASSVASSFETSARNARLSSDR